MKKQERVENESCFACKITTICCLFGISAYLVYQGRIQKKQSRYSMYALATGCINIFKTILSYIYLFLVTGGLGVGEIFDKSPFRNTS